MPGKGLDGAGIVDSCVIRHNVSLRLTTFTLAAWILPTMIQGANRIAEKGNSNSYYLVGLLLLRARSLSEKCKNRHFRG